MQTEFVESLTQATPWSREEPVPAARMQSRCIYQVCILWNISPVSTYTPIQTYKLYLSVAQARLSALDEQWQFLVNKSAEKSQKLKEANKQQNFNTGIKDFDFWLSEVTICLPTINTGTNRKQMISKTDAWCCFSGGSPSCLRGLWKGSGFSQQSAEETPAAGGWYFCPWGTQLIFLYKCISFSTQYILK